jgi:hypothetical protein
MFVVVFRIFPHLHRLTQTPKIVPAFAERWTPEIGETAKISASDGGSEVWAFVSEDALDEYKTASLSGRDFAMAAFRSLTSSGKVISTRNGTAVTIVQANGLNGWRKASVLDDDHAGQKVYFLDQWTVYTK